VFRVLRSSVYLLAIHRRSSILTAKWPSPSSTIARPQSQQLICSTTECLPFFEEHEVALSRVLTDRGTEYCGTDSHVYELYLALWFFNSARGVPMIDSFSRIHSTCWLSRSHPPFNSQFSLQPMGRTPFTLLQPLHSSLTSGCYSR
jgi:hypothetical protein